VNFLQLVQRLRRKCRVAGSGPTALTGQNEEYNRLIDWTNEAWMKIQRRHETQWSFMRAICSAATINGQAAYGNTEFGVTDIGQFVLNYATDDTFRCYQTAAGPASEQFLEVIDYDEWRDRYLFGALRTSYQRPTCVAVGPDEKLYLGPIPTAGWTITGDYIRAPSEMVVASDVPGVVNGVGARSLPSRYDMAIVYRAMMLYGVSEAAAEVYQDGQADFTAIITEIERTQLPRIRLGGPLA
jgi:hypothetical protein